MGSKLQNKINDFSITISTVNGSGSTTANNLILKSLFRMGIPVSARNIFPSNIQGMPTWYHLRISSDGYLGRVERSNILICMNPETIEKDLLALEKNSLIVINDSIKIPDLDGTTPIVRMPVDQLMENSDTPSNLSLYLENMLYVGVLAYLIGIDLEEINNALMGHFKGKKVAVETNMSVIEAAFNWTKGGKFSSQFKLQKEDSGQNKILVDGNQAAALGSLFGGLQFTSWYPITPATSLPESLIENIPRLRTDPETGIANCAILQAEDELAAIGMVVGAGWAGLRSMTATSGPGLCLMTEFLGLAYFAEIPAVVWDVQRVGPSTGLPTHSSQGDLAFVYSLGHGDTDAIILIPATMKECFEFGWQALDFADEFQTPVIVLSDLDLGMNLWISDPFEYPDKPIEKGKLLWENGLNNFLKKHSHPFSRYMDVDGDGVPYRTVPGNMHPDSAYFTRGTGHDADAHYSEDADTWQENLNRLKNKIKKSAGSLPQPIVEVNQDSPFGVISYGSTHFPVIEVIREMDEFNLDYLRIRAIPFSELVKNFIESHEKVIVVENNRDGQLKRILCSEYPNQAAKLFSISKCDGLSLSAEWISKKIIHLWKEN